MDQRSETKANIGTALKLKPQARKVLHHMEQHGYITPSIAINTYGIWRLAACIHNIRSTGIDVKTDIRKDAEGHQYARYELRKRSALH
jgi:hypothetical protein